MRVAVTLELVVQIGVRVDVQSSAVHAPTIGAHDWIGHRVVAAERDRADPGRAAERFRLRLPRVLPQARRRPRCLRHLRAGPEPRRRHHARSRITGSQTTRLQDTSWRSCGTSHKRGGPIPRHRSMQFAIWIPRYLKRLAAFFADAAAQTSCNDNISEHLAAHQAMLPTGPVQASGQPRGVDPSYGGGRILRRRTARSAMC